MWPSYGHLIAEWRLLFTADNIWTSFWHAFCTFFYGLDFALLTKTIIKSLINWHRQIKNQFYGGTCLKQYNLKQKCYHCLFLNPFTCELHIKVWKSHFFRNSDSQQKMTSHAIILLIIEAIYSFVVSAIESYPTLSNKIEPNLINYLEKVN